MKFLTDVDGKFVPVEVYTIDNHSRVCIDFGKGKHLSLNNFEMHIHTKYITVAGYERKSPTQFTDYIFKYFNLYPTTARKI